MRLRSSGSSAPIAGAVPRRCTALLIMVEPITEYYLIEFPTPDLAEEVAGTIADCCLAHGLVVGNESPLRPVIWSGSPLAATGALYLSVGAVNVARVLGLALTPARRVAIEELPLHRTLLLGEARERI
jgi:hypothetical protein